MPPAWVAAWSRNIAASDAGSLQAKGTSPAAASQAPLLALVDMLAGALGKAARDAGWP